jgi:multisubunit Na+/H+ antiporter MnhB subunit
MYLAMTTREKRETEKNKSAARQLKVLNAVLVLGAVLGFLAVWLNTYNGLIGSFMFNSFKFSISLATYYFE